MKITEISVKRPIAMSMFVMVFVILGLYTYTKMSVELFPAINVPYITIQTSYPGAGAQEVEQQIVKPTEDALSSLSKVKNIMSIASEGSAITILEYDLSADANQAAMDAQKKIDSIKGLLPEGTTTPVVIKQDMNAMPIMTLALSSDRPLNETYDYAKDVVKERLQKVAGVSDVAVTGGQERQIEVKVNKTKLESYGLSLNQVLNRLRSENLSQPSGRVDRPEAEYNLRMLGEFTSIDDIKNLSINLQDGSTIRLKDVADIRNNYVEKRSYARLNRMPAIAITLFKQSDASVVDVSDMVNAELPNIKAELPKDVKLTVSTDNAEFIKKSLNGTTRSLIEAILTTAFALLLFLREWRSVFIVLLAIPTSLLAAVMMMYFSGFTFNMMSLLGLTLCIGILVDDSIVVLENIHRHYKMGKSPAKAAVEGREEIGLAAIAITLSDVVIFAPIAFMSGMVGQFFRQFGLTVVFATLFSLFVSFTLTPMAASLLFKEHADVKIRKKGSILGLISDGLGRFGSYFTDIYKKTLLWSLNHRKKVVVVALLAFFACITLIYPFKIIGMEFMAKSDQNQLSVSLELPIGAPMAKTDKALQEIEKFISTIPEVKYQYATLGSGGMGFSGGANQGSIGISLVSRSTRPRTVWQIGDEIRNWATNFKDGKIKVSEADSMGGGGPGGAITIDVLGSDTMKLAEVGDKVKKIVQGVPGTVDVDTNWRLGQPEIQATLKRDKLAWMGLSVSDVTKGVRAAVNGEKTGVYRAEDNEININVKVDNLNKADLETLKSITITTVSGNPVQLGEIADIKYGSGPTQIRRLNKQRTMQVTGNIRDRSLNDVVLDITKKLDAANLPAGYSYRMSGQTQAMNETFGQLILAMILSITLVYMVLTMLYESFSTPLIRMVSLPLGMVGAFSALAITGYNLGMMPMIGLVMMDGLVAKNGTLLLDYTITLRQRGYNLREALIEAGMTRMRPIMMTTFTMIFGMMPLALSNAEGSEMTKGIAIVLIGGLITSTFFTLLVIPSVYTLLDDFTNKISSFFKRKKKPLEAIDTNVN